MLEYFSFHKVSSLKVSSLKVFIRDPERSHRRLIPMSQKKGTLIRSIVDVCVRGGGGVYTCPIYFIMMGMSG